ncbi:hypothetical protein EV193_11093 [Herbihabitans rhizosphaerae]|uniref:Uncharacterized protein n=1 Tax=Herbihabitans rhizosphaerae TaxID=1872711 RepID=A0A4Q7KFF6_9PSEU|nr:hypothetical protein [Herbihabitans rhizosphaerae]RZS33943.1 hypothetical protein EV193_11093 [Herbihabitans rhizosphaerae]
MPDGYGFDPGVLPGIAEQLKGAARSLDHAMGAQQPCVAFAGQSSAQVGAAVRLVNTARVVLAEVLEDNASKINYTFGSYGEIENTQAGNMRLRELPSGEASDPGGLWDAPERGNYLPGRKWPN